MLLGEAPPDSERASYSSLQACLRAVLGSHASQLPTVLGEMVAMRLP